MILLVDSVQNLPPSASKRDIEASTNAARWAGFRIVHIEPDFRRCETADAALWMLESVESEAAFWLGYIPSVERYRAIFQACADKGYRLPNDPEEHCLAMELDRAYPKLLGLTPKTVLTRSPQEAVEVTGDLTFPVFVKGAVQSKKSEGWSSCIAEGPEELGRLVERILRSQDRTRGKVVIRELLALRHTKKSGLGFPIGREYRVFLYRGKVVSLAYYWDSVDEYGALSADEKNTVVELARQAAARLAVPFVAVDVGQDESLKWWVIETADGQFAGISPEVVVHHWNRLKES